MKRLFIAIVLIALVTNTEAQRTSSDNGSKNKETSSTEGIQELRFNILWAIFGMPEVNYEYFIADNMGIGVSGAVAIEEKSKWEERFHFIPYYRLYFGEKKASGFFIEGNMGVAGLERLAGTDSWGNPVTAAKGTSFGFGAAIGVKLLARNGFLGEIVAGATRVFGNPVQDAIPRIGITLGKRF